MLIRNGRTARRGGVIPETDNSGITVAIGPVWSGVVVVVDTHPRAGQVQAKALSFVLFFPSLALKGKAGRQWNARE